MLIPVLGPCDCPDLRIKVEKLMDMGIDRDVAFTCLSSNDWDLEKATEQLFR